MVENDIMKLRIAFDAKRLFNNFTGLGNYSRTLVRNLVEAYPENEYHLITPKITSNKETSFFNSYRFVIHTPKTKLFSGYWRTFNIPKILEENEIDIYHGLSHELPLTRVSSRCITVVSFHDLIYEIYPKQFSYFDQKSYRYKYSKAVKNADKVIAISNSTKMDLIKWYDVTESKISLLYQAANNYFTPPKDAIPLSKRSSFLFVGSIIERKGVDHLIKVYQKYGDKLPPLKVIGGGSGYKTKMIQHVAGLKLEDKVHFIEQTSNAELMRYYQNAIATILPSQYEGFGIPIIESLLCHTPVITSNISSLPEACGPGGILVNPNEVDEIFNAMIAIQNPKDHVEFILKGSKYVQDTFDGKSLAHQLMTIYKSILI